MQTQVKRLAAYFLPAHYAIHIDLTKAAKRQFSGTVTITGELKHRSNNITLHNNALAIASAHIDGQPVRWEVQKDDELLLRSKELLHAGEHTITITYTGVINDLMHGIYPCYFTYDSKEQELIATQFESHSAREAFPCIDEPAAKATFDLTLTTQPGITVLANTPVLSQKTKSDAMVTTFATSPRMSTYLLAFVIGELGYTETTNKNGVTIRAYATLDKVEQTGFATAYAAKVLDFYDDYFALPYPLAKCDMVALPDFSSGAMENWGLITFRESAMLVAKDTPADSKQQIATTISHELAHQWFGNLVTMAWWDDLWLNESFASWIAEYVNDHFYPEWQSWELFSASDQQSALSRDSLASVQAVQQHVSHPDEIQTQFDSAIVYAKGACLLRMLHEYLGANDFRAGLRLYMQRHKYSNTATADLWQALMEASGKDVKAFMQPWITQPGHPVLKITHKEGQTLLHQQRFYANPNAASKNDHTLWPVPLLHNGNKDMQLLAKAQTTIPKKRGLDIFNKGGTGFYHVHYDETTLHDIAATITKGTLPAVDRQRLLFDQLALTKAGVTSTTELLTLAAAYKNESVYSVWLAIQSAVAAVKTLIDNDSILKPALQRYVAALTSHEMARLGWKRQKNESYFDELLRPMIIANQAYAEVPEVLQHAKQLYDKAAQPEDLPSELRSIIYGVAIRHYGASAYEQLITWYKQTTSAEERINLCAGICQARDATLIGQALALIPTKTIKNQDAVYWFIYLMRNTYSREPAWQWVQQHWQWVKDTFAGDMDYSYFPRFAAAGMSTAQQLQDYKTFFTPKLAEPALARVIQQGIEDIETRVLWRQRDLAAIADFFAT